MPYTPRPGTAPVPNKPGKTNWVEKVGGLPSYIRRIAEHLIGQGHSTSAAIATAVNTVKRWAAGGTVTASGGPRVSAKTQALASKALAEWNAKKARSHSMTAFAYGLVLDLSGSLDFVGDRRPPYDYKHGWIPISAAAKAEQAAKAAAAAKKNTAKSTLKTSTGGKTIDTDVGGKLRGSDANVKSVHGKVKLSKRETDAIAYYEGDWETVNSVLRDPSSVDLDEEAEGEITEVIHGLDSAFEKVPPLDHDIVTYRGIPGDLVERLSEGDSWRDDGYVSTSKHQDATQDYGDWVLEIHTPAGNKALDMVHLGRGDWQDEVLLPAGTEWKVESVEDGRVVLRTKPTGAHSSGAKDAEISDQPPAPAASKEKKPKSAGAQPTEAQVEAAMYSLAGSTGGQLLLTIKNGTPAEQEAARRLLREVLKHDPNADRVRAAAKQLGIDLSRTTTEDGRMASVTDAANVLDLASESEATGAKWSHGWVPLNEAAKKIAARRGKQGDPRFKKYAKGSKAPADDKSGRGGGSHTVKEGDTLWAIAARELGSGSRWKEIARANGVKNPRLLQIGTKLKIPGTAKGIAPGERHPKGPSKVRKRRKKVPGKGRQTIRGTKIPRGGISQYIREKNLSDSAATPEGFELIDLTPTSSWNTEAREKAASKGQAMPGGRFPIKDKRDVQKAIRALGRAKGSHAAVKAHIIRRARALGCEHYIPDSWKSADMAGAAGFDAIDLAGRWRHGWIPLDAVAALEKAKGNHAAASRYLGSGRSLTPSQGRGSIGGMSTYSAPRQLQSSRHTESGGSLGAQDRRGTAAWMKRNSRKRYSGKSANELKQAAQHHYNRSFPGSVPQEERDKSGKELNYIINAYMSEHRAGLRDRAVAMRELGLPVGRAGTGRLKPVDEPKQPVSTLQGRPDANDQITEGDERLRRLLSGDRVAAARAKSAELRSLSDQELSLRRGSDDTTPAQRRAIDAEIDRRKGQPSGSAKHRVSPGDKIDAEAKYSQGQGVRVVRNGVFQQEGTIVGFDRHGAARVRNSKDGTVTSFYARDLEPASSPAAKLRSGKPANLPNNARPVTGDDGEILGYSSKAGTRDTHQRGGQGNVSTGMSRRQTWDVFDAEGNKIDTVINSADAANVLRVRAARAKQGPGTATQQRYVPKSLAENLPEGAAVHKSGNGFKATNARGFSRTFDSLAEATAYARGGAAPAKKQAPSGDLEARLGQMSTRSLEDLAKHGSSQQSQIARRILTRRKAK